MLAAFEQADSLEVYTRHWPEEENSDHTLATFSREDDAERWESFVDSARGARPRAPHKGVAYLSIRLRANGRVLVTGWAYPPAGEVALWLSDERLAAVSVAAPLNEIFGPFHDEVQRACSQAYRQYLEEHPSERRPTAEEPALPDFDQAKARMVKLFGDCRYINIHAPGENSMGVNVREEGREAWQTMANGIAEADKGWAIPGGQVEVYVWCEDPEAPARLIELHYVGGILGATDRYYGGDVRTLRPGPAFKQGLDSILAIAREKQRREQGPGEQ